jgi:hypothetical protein
LKFAYFLCLNSYFMNAPEKFLRFVLPIAIYSCLASCHENKAFLPGPDRRMFLPKLGYMKGNVIKVKSISIDNIDKEDAEPLDVYYTLDHKAKTLTESIEGGKFREIIYLNKYYAADSMVKIRISSDSVYPTIVYQHLPVYFDMTKYFLLDTRRYIIDSSNKNEIKITVENFPTLSSVSIYYFNSKRQETRVTTMLPDQPLQNTFSEYNEYGHLIRIKTVYEGCWDVECRLEYEYDKYGNWTLMKLVETKADGKKIRRKVERKITYAD